MISDFNRNFYEPDRRIGGSVFDTCWEKVNV